MHVKKEKDRECVVPASGLVTAIEPILKACGGTWVAHGSGDADREMVDENDQLRVPPEEPQYILKRVWLTREEEKGYYYGFAKEGLWPLCHIAHKHSGILTHSIEGTAYWLKQLLQKPNYARRLGQNGREHVLQNFLLTCHLRDYMLLFLSLFHDGDLVNLSA